MHVAMPLILAETDLMGLIWILIVGGVIGWLASLIMKTNGQMGLLMNIVVGIVGAWLGSWLARQLGIVTSGKFEEILVALGGAVLLIVILKMLRVLR